MEKIKTMSEALIKIDEFENYFDKEFKMKSTITTVPEIEIRKFAKQEKLPIYEYKTFIHLDYWIGKHLYNFIADK